VIVAGELPRETHNAPLHLFSASPDLVGFGRGAYRRHSENTSELLGNYSSNSRGGIAMSYTMEDFKRDTNRKHFLKLPLKEATGDRAIAAAEGPERTFAGATAGGTAGGPVKGPIRAYLDQPPPAGQPHRASRGGKGNAGIAVWVRGDRGMDSRRELSRVTRTGSIGFIQGSLAKKNPA